jgi:hypothetical protein
MKKFLSIFVAVAMVLSLFAGALAPRASAVVSSYLTDDGVSYTKKVKATNARPVASKGLRYFTTANLPTFAAEGTYNATPGDAEWVYFMGDVIHGRVTFTDTAVGGTYSVILVRGDYATNGTAAIDVADIVDTFNGVQTSTTQLAYDFTLATGNVMTDGLYKIFFRETNGLTPEPLLAEPHVLDAGGAFWSEINYNGNANIGTVPSNGIYIMYNLTWDLSKIPVCKGFVTLSGWIRRGFGQTVTVPVTVKVGYPSATANRSRLAATYTILAGSSGQFTVTFFVDPTATGLWAGEQYWIGQYPVFLEDSYTGASTTADNIIYDFLGNTPANTSLTVTTYISPVLLYKSVNNQPLLLKLVDQNGNPVSGATWLVGYGTTPATPIAPTTWVGSPGFYYFTLNVPNAVDVRLVANKMIYGASTDSNAIILNTRDLGAFNPYIDVHAADAPTWDCKLQRYVYSKLPCTIGDALYLKADYWAPIDPDNWYMREFSATVNGPVRDLDTSSSTNFAADYESTFIIEKAGKISISVSALMWEKKNQTGDCYDWFHGSGDYGWYDEGGNHGRIGTFHGGWNDDPEGLALMSENACCHTYEKTFDVCEVISCSLVGVTVENGQQTTATSIEVYKKADLVVNVSGISAPANLSCGCNTKIVHIYMTKCDPAPGVTNSTTVLDAYGYGVMLPGAFTVDTYGGGTSTVTDLWYNGVAGSPFPATTASAIVIDNCEKLTFKGVTFNYIDESGNPCSYRLVVEVFGLERDIDACGNMTLSYPYISDTLNNIAITAAVTTKTVTETITEGALDPGEMLAGVSSLIDITDPLFTVSGYRGVGWTAKLNGTTTSSLDYPVSMVPTPTDTGYRFNFTCAFSEAGDLVITGTNWSTYCDKKEVVTLTTKIVMPAFEVKIGLADGTTIANDHVVTEGFAEKLYVTATDPRADGHHDFTTDTTWKLAVEAVLNDCYLPTSYVCGSSFLNGCTTPSPIIVSGYDNPNIEDAPQFNLQFVAGNCAYLLVDTFTLVAPTVSVSPTEVPFTIPASATHVVFTVKDAHAHGAPGVDVAIEGTTLGGAGASGYSFTAGSAITDNNGEADWAFVPPYSGKYYVYVSDIMGTCLQVQVLDGDSYDWTHAHMCGWDTSLPEATITAKYMAAVVDTTAPVVTLTAGLDGSTVSSATFNLTGKVTDNVGVTQLFVGFNKVDVLPDGSFMTALKLVEGENAITVVAYDAAGNKGTVTAKVTYTAPVSTKTVLVLTIGADIVSVNGKATSIDAAPEIVASRTFVPIRFIAEAFGATVEWLPETQGITITLGDHTIGLQIGNSTAVIDGSIISLPAAPYIKNGRTMVPLRVISESFGGDVVWDPTARTITITYQP